MKKLIFIYISILFFLLPFLCRAEREKIGLSVDQSIFSFNLYPGEEQEFALKIKNITGEKQRIKINLKDFSVDDNNKVSLLNDRNELFGMKDWIILENEDVWLMEGGEEKLIKFTIKVPGDASVGSHYSAVLFNILPEIDFNNFQKPIIGGEIGTYIFLNIGGEISGNGAIKDFFSPKIIEKETNFKIIFKNEGNIHYVPYGEIKIKNLLNRKNENYKLSKHFVFPGKSYTFEHKWQAPSAFGIYTAEAFFIDQAGRSLSEKRLIFGRYFIIIAILAVISAIIILIFRWRKTKKLKMKSENLEPEIKSQN